MPVKAICHLALGLQFCLSVGERSTWVVVVVMGGVSQGSHKAFWAVGRWSGSRAARRRIKDLAWSETGFQYRLWNSILDQRFARRERWCCGHEKGGSRRGESRWWWLCRREQWACVLHVHVCRKAIPVDQISSVAGVFDDFGCDVTKRTHERGELLVGEVKEFCSVKRWTKGSGEMEEEAHAKVSNGNATLRVLGAVEDVLGSEEWVKGEGRDTQTDRQRKCALLAY